MTSLVLLRHGESSWNQQNVFTGWTDVDLTEQGTDEAHRAGIYLREAGFTFDIAYTSLLKRAIRTLWIVLDEMDAMWLPVVKTWRLNERHYGALQGLDKHEMADRAGSEQVFQWRRSFTVQPPPLDIDDPRHPRFDPRYAGIDPSLLPPTESLADTLRRALPCWEEDIRPRLMAEQRVLVVAHGNSLRALVKHLDRIPDEQTPELNIPLGIPIAYRLDASFQVLGRDYVGPPDVVRLAAQKAERAARIKGQGTK